MKVYIVYCEDNYCPCPLYVTISKDAVPLEDDWWIEEREFDYNGVINLSSCETKDAPFGSLYFND